METETLLSRSGIERSDRFNVATAQTSEIEARGRMRSKREAMRPSRVTISAGRVMVYITCTVVAGTMMLGGRTLLKGGEAGR